MSQSDGMRLLAITCTRASTRSLLALYFLWYLYASIYMSTCLVTMASRWVHTKVLTQCVHALLSWVLCLIHVLLSCGALVRMSAEQAHKSDGILLPIGWTVCYVMARSVNNGFMWLYRHSE